MEDNRKTYPFVASAMLLIATLVFTQGCGLKSTFVEDDEEDSGLVDLTDSGIIEDASPADTGQGMGPGAGWPPGFDGARPDTGINDAGISPPNVTGRGQVCTLELEQYADTIFSQFQLSTLIPGFNADSIELPPLTGRCSTDTDPCPGGTMREATAAISGVDPSTVSPEEVALDCNPSLRCCFDTDQCGRLGVSIDGAVQTILDGPSMFSPNSTLRDTLAGFGLGNVTVSGTCEGGCGNALLDLPIGCNQGTSCCIRTPLDSLLGMLGGFLGGGG